MRRWIVPPSAADIEIDAIDGGHTGCNVVVASTNVRHTFCFTALPTPSREPAAPAQVHQARTASAVHTTGVNVQ